MAGPSRAGPGAGGAAEGWHAAPAIICIPQLSNVGLGAATAMGRGLAAPWGRTRPPAHVPAPSASCQSHLPRPGVARSGERIRGPPPPRGDALRKGQALAAKQSALTKLGIFRQAEQAIWLLCQAAHAVPRQGRGETGVRPPPRLSHQSCRDQREEAVLRRVDSSEPEESKQYPLSSAFPWRREGAEEP